MYDRTDGERTLTFDFGSGLVKDNLLVVDRETSSIWSQLHNQAITGPLQGKPMKIVPTLQTTWSFWKSLHPETTVVLVEGEQGRPYLYRSRASGKGGENDGGGVGGHDLRDLGLGLVHGGVKLFAPLGTLAPGEHALLLGGERVTLTAEPDALTAWAEDAHGRLLPGVLAYRAGWFDFHPDSLELRQDGSLAPPEKTPADAAALEVRMLANEGFLLSAGELAVAIDAFVAEPYVGYGALTGDTLAALESGTKPFHELDLVLASHVHRDHFQGEPAQRFLASLPECRFVSSPQVVEALWAAETDAAEFVPREAVTEILPAPGGEELFEADGIRVEFLHLSHGTGRFQKIENMGHVITVGGVTALHVGDAAMVARNFAPYRLGERGIDVAFVPYWYFGDPSGLAIVDEHFRPARLIACHIPPAELAAVTKRFATEFPGVIVPQEPLELFRIEDEH